MMAPAATDIVFSDRDLVSRPKWFRGKKVAMQPICGTRLKIWGSKTKTNEIVLTSAVLPFMNNNNFDKTLWQV